MPLGKDKSSDPHVIVAYDTKGLHFTVHNGKYRASEQWLTLAHEFVHAEEIVRTGTLDPNNGLQYSFKRTLPGGLKHHEAIYRYEADTVGIAPRIDKRQRGRATENSIRKENRIPLRRTYGLPSLYAINAVSPQLFDFSFSKLKK